MSLIELLRLALFSLVHNRLRSILTILGIVIGVAAVVALVSFGQSYQNYVLSQFQGIGANTLTISSTNPSGPNAKTLKVRPLTMKDAEAIANPAYVSSVMAVAPTFNVNATLVANSQSMSEGVTGSTASFEVVRDQTVSSGRFISESDVNTSSMVAVLGTGIVQKLFPNNPDPVGQVIRIDNLTFTVIGVLQARGGGGGNQDRTVVVPITTAQTRLGGDNARTSTGEYRVSQIALKTTSVEAINQTKADVSALLFDRHQIQYVGEEDFNVFTPGAILDTLDSILNLLTLFLGAIAGISLLVGGIGVMNIMMVTVTERTREIGLRKAVGARYVDLLIQFLLESVALCLLGGFLGVALGWCVTVIGGVLLPTLKLAISSQAIILAVSVSTAIGLFFGLYPASRAAVLSPIEALRYE